MGENTHINVTIDFVNWNDHTYDLRIPTYQTVKQLLLNLRETLNLVMPNESLFRLKITTKDLLLVDDDFLLDYPVADGDIIIVY